MKSKTEKKVLAVLDRIAEALDGYRFSTAPPKVDSRIDENAGREELEQAKEVRIFARFGE